jgi:LDH2 family malate/lactate/ureidoglycolate dehydrogenase
MAIYPKSNTDRRVPHANLKKVVGEIFVRCGMSADDADLVAETLVHADLRGIHSHGVLRVQEYVEKLTTGGINPTGRPGVASIHGGAIVVDACNSMGQIGGTYAMREAVKIASSTGVAFAAVRSSNHCGAMEWYTLLAAQENMIGVAGTNALPTMAPWGGLDKIVGINPLSVAIPAQEERPLVLDFAFGATAHGKIRVYQQKGIPIPDGWAFDKDGRPTIDTDAALVGLIQPIGQHKGVGLGMVVGILSTLLSGAAYGTELGNMVDGSKAGRDGHFFLVINIAAFEQVERFKRRVDKIVREVHDSRCREGVDRLLVPGELEASFERAYATEGIPLAATTINDIAEQAEKLRVDASMLFVGFSNLV